MYKGLHRSTLRKIGQRTDLPCVPWEMDWVFFCAKPKHWKGGWGNPKKLYGVPSRQERRADISEREQRRELVEEG